MGPPLRPLPFKFIPAPPPPLWTYSQGGPLGPRFFFLLLLRTALKDRPKGPSIANHQPPPTASRHQPPTANCRQPPAATNRQPPTTANCHQPPIPNHQLLPTTINRHQPPSTASRQAPSTNRQPPTHGVPVGISGKPGYRNTSFFSSSLRTALHTGVLNMLEMCMPNELPNIAAHTYQDVRLVDLHAAPPLF